MHTTEQASRHLALGRLLQPTAGRAHALPRFMKTRPLQFSRSRQRWLMLFSLGTFAAYERH